MCRDALGDCLYRPREWLPEDVSQTLFCRVLQAAWEPQKGPLGGWLVVIIQRIVTDAVKAAYGRRTRTADVWSESQQAGMPRAALTEDETSDPLQLLIGRDLQDRMMDAVESLPFAERQVVTLRYIEGYTLQELSTTLSIPLATLARRLRKTVTRLAELLGPWDGTGRIAGET
jgi:RNA polymerase sigma-70 factor (ECF subfamily)